MRGMREKALTKKMIKKSVRVCQTLPYHHYFLTLRNFSIHRLTFHLLRKQKMGEKRKLVNGN